MREHANSVKESINIAGFQVSPVTPRSGLHWHDELPHDTRDDEQHKG